MLKRFYLLLFIFSGAVLSPLFIFPLGIEYDISNILFLLYVFLPCISLIILYRGNFLVLWKNLNFSRGQAPFLDTLKSLFFWNVLFYGGLCFATLLGFYSWDFEQEGLSNWISNQLNEFAETNQVPIPLLPFTTKEMARLGIITSVLLPFCAFPFFFLQELVWRCWLPSQYDQNSLTDLVKLNGIWGIWHIPLILSGRIYGDSVIGVPAILISTILQGILLSFVTRKTGSIFSATVARGFIFTSAPLVIIFHETGSTTSPFIVGLYGVFSWILMGVAIFWYRDIFRNAS